MQVFLFFFCYSFFAVCFSFLYFLIPYYANDSRRNFRLFQQILLANLLFVLYFYFVIFVRYRFFFYNSRAACFCVLVQLSYIKLKNTLYMHFFLFCCVVGILAIREQKFHLFILLFSIWIFISEKSIVTQVVNKVGIYWYNVI